MSYTLYWTLQAEETFAANLEYLEKSWTNAVINDFLDRVDEVLQPWVKIHTLIRYTGNKEALENA